MEKVICKHLNLDFRGTTHGNPTWNPDDEHVKHIWARTLIKRVGKKTWDSCFSFAFVRNPYDMVLSLYSMFTQYSEYTGSKELPPHYHPWNQYANFEDFLLKVDNGECSHGKIQWWHNLRDLQTRYLTKRYSRLWWRPRETMVDFVGRYENLEEHFAHVCRQIGLPELELIHHGATEHRPYNEMYTPKTRRIVEKHFRGDLQRFGYGFN